MPQTGSDLKTNILDLREQGKTYKEIVDILGCSKGTVSFHCSKMKGHKEVVKAHHEAEKTRRAPERPPVEGLKPTDYESKWILRLADMGIRWKEIADALGLPLAGMSEWMKDQGRVWEKGPSIENRKAVHRRMWRLKALTVAHKGGCCERCGFDTLGALTFHHRDPSEKEFAIGGQTRSWERVKEEVGKCDLLCLNCHREVHEEINRSRHQSFVFVRDSVLVASGERLCEHSACTNTFPRQGRKKFCSDSCSHTHRTRLRREQVRARIYAYKGQHCEECGYDRSKHALEFHHRNPDEKAFEVSQSYSKNWDCIREELDKCQVLCANCHQLTHGGFWC